MCRNHFAIAAAILFSFFDPVFIYSDDVPRDIRQLRDLPIEERRKIAQSAKLEMYASVQKNREFSFEQKKKLINRLEKGIDNQLSIRGADQNLTNAVSAVTTGAVTITAYLVGAGPAVTAVQSGALTVGGTAASAAITGFNINEKIADSFENFLNSPNISYLFSNRADQESASFIRKAMISSAENTQISRGTVSGQDVKSQS